MKKDADRVNVLTEVITDNANSNFVHAVLNALMKGYSDKTIFFDIIELVRLDQISLGVLKTSPDVLRSYAKSFNESLNYIADKIEKISEFKQKAVEDAEGNNEDEE